MSVIIIAKKYNKVRAFKMLNTYLFICFDCCSALRENEQLNPNHQTAYAGGKTSGGQGSCFPAHSQAGSYDLREERSLLRALHPRTTEQSVLHSVSKSGRLGSPPTQTLFLNHSNFLHWEKESLTYWWGPDLYLSLFLFVSVCLSLSLSFTTSTFCFIIFLKKIAYEKRGFNRYRHAEKQMLIKQMLLIIWHLSHHTPEFPCV